MGGYSQKVSEGGPMLAESPRGQPFEMTPVPLVTSASIAALYAQQKLPFVLDLNTLEANASENETCSDTRRSCFLKKLGWTSVKTDSPEIHSANSNFRSADEIFRRCPLAQAACWHALLTP